MLSAALQVLALVLGVVGVVGVAVATLLPNWSVSVSGWAGGASPVSQTRGLWTDCVWFVSGAFSCGPKLSPLSLPAYLQTARAAMALAPLVATLALCLAALGLKCARWGGGRRAKAHTAVAAGGLLLISGLLCLLAASWFTSEVVAAFLTSDLPDGSRQQPGGAIGLAFVSAGFLLAAGIILCMSCPGNDSSSRGGGGERGGGGGNVGGSSVGGGIVVKTTPKRSVKLQTDEETPSRPQEVVRDGYGLQEYV